MIGRHGLLRVTMKIMVTAHAGSLVNLAKYPASTVQILGAEKALFRYGPAECTTLLVRAIWRSP